MGHISLNKIEKELSKGSISDQVAAYSWIKSFITLKVMEHQKQLAEKANELQLTLDSINGPSAANL